MPPKKKDAEEEVGNAARFGRVRNTLKMGIVGECPRGTCSQSRRIHNFLSRPRFGEKHSARRRTRRFSVGRTTASAAAALRGESKVHGALLPGGQVVEPLPPPWGRHPHHDAFCSNATHEREIHPRAGPRRRRPTQRGQVLALQPPDAASNRRGELPVLHHRAQRIALRGRALTSGPDLSVP